MSKFQQTIRIDHQLRELIAHKADEAGLTITEWIRRAVVDAATRSERKQHQKGVKA
jgi:predicted HicB family RNase H-like nuclease